MDARSFYNATAEVYDLRHDSPATLLVRKREQSLVKRFARGRILDVGCGTGFHIRSGVTGLDISEKMLGKARARSGLLVQGSESLPVRTGSIGTILCFFTVFNMVRPETAVGEFRRVLAPGGRVLLTVASIFDHGGAPGKTLQVHGKRLRIRLFTLGELKGLFSGFALEHFDGLFISAAPQWGVWEKPGSWEASLRQDRFLPKEGGRIYCLVFKKTAKNF